MRTTTEHTRRVIEQVALSTFCLRGYGVATLEEIGAAVGLTRGAVLHHFNSKADLLAAAVDPYRRALAEFVLHTRVDDPPSAGQRRCVISAFTDLLLAHRDTLRLLATDVSARVQLGVGDQWSIPQGRVMTMLVGSEATGLSHVRATAALGAMIQPISSAWFDLDAQRVRDQLIEAALAVLDLGDATSPAEDLPTASLKTSAANARDRY